MPQLPSLTDFDLRRDIGDISKPAGWKSSILSFPLKTNEDLNSHLEAALEDGDPGLIFAVLGHITRARNLRLVGLAEKQPQCLFQKSPLF